MNPLIAGGVAGQNENSSIKNFQPCTQKNPLLQQARGASANPIIFYVANPQVSTFLVPKTLISFPKMITIIEGPGVF